MKNQIGLRVKKLSPATIWSGIATISAACIFNIIMLPAESVGVVGEQLALGVRISAWLLFTAVALLHFKQRLYISPRAVAVAIGYIALFYLANFASVSFFQRWMLFVWAVIVGALLINIAEGSSTTFRQLLCNVYTITLVFWIAAFLLQLSLYFATGSIYDFHKMLIAYSEQRAELIGSTFVRLGGVHIEPGTYTNWLYGVLLLRALHTRRVFDRLSICAMCTIPLTGSLWGAISFVFFVCAYFASFSVRDGGRGLAVVAIAVAAFGVAASTVVFGDLAGYLESRVSFGGASSEAKLEGIAGFLANLDQYFFFGETHDFDFCGGCISPQDSGVFINTAVRIGVVWAVVVFWLFYRGVYRTLGLRGVLFALPVVYAKWYYWEFLFWMIIFSSLLRNPTNRIPD